MRLANGLLATTLIVVACADTINAEAVHQEIQLSAAWQSWAWDAHESGHCGAAAGGRTGVQCIKFPTGGTIWGWRWSSQVFVGFHVVLVGIVSTTAGVNQPLAMMLHETHSDYFDKGMCPDTINERRMNLPFGFVVPPAGEIWILVDGFNQNYPPSAPSPAISVNLTLLYEAPTPPTWHQPIYPLPSPASVCPVIH